jgi:hypothetical protein
MNAMTRRAVLTTTTGFVAGMLSTLALVPPASAGDGRPFKGHAKETVISAEPTLDGLLVTTVGAGLATHLGRFTRDASVLIHGDGTFQGTVVFTAANGDQLFTDLEGMSTSPTMQVGTYTFTGGTGRFEDAFGVATFRGLTADGIHVALTFEGTIQY